MDSAQIYLIGQTHSSEKHALYIEEEIRDLEPESVLLEQLDDHEHNELTDEIRVEGQTYNFGRVAEYLETFERMPELFNSSNTELLEKIERAECDDNGKVPTKEEELYETSWMEMDSAALETLVRDIEEQLQAEKEEFNKWTEKDVNPSEYDQKISELEKIAHNYQNNIQSRRMSQNTQEERVKAAVYDLHAKGVKTELRGCDLDKEAEFIGLSKEEAQEKALSKQFNERRNIRESYKIAESAEEHNDLVIASIGRAHLPEVKNRLEDKGHKVIAKKLQKDENNSEEYEEEVWKNLDIE